MIYLSPFTRADCDALSAILEDRLRLHLAAKTLVRRVTDLGTGPIFPAPLQHAGTAAPEETGSIPDWDCPTCENERITLNWADSTVKPCFTCQPVAYAQFISRHPELEEAAATQRSADIDSWDMSAEEQADGAIRLTAREMCDGESGRGSGCPSSKGDRGGWDPWDDKADIQPFERTTK